MTRVYLPQVTYKKPDAASVPILAPPAHVLKKKKRVVVIVNDPIQDLGILAYRSLQREPGVNGGSVVNFAKELLHRSAKNEEKVGVFKPNYDLFQDGAGIFRGDVETPGLVVLNCGQLLYSHSQAKAMTIRSWLRSEERRVGKECPV